MKKYNVNVWLINTGWSGGPYLVGKRIDLKYTRAMITAALNGKLDIVTYQSHNLFGFAIPESCPGVPSEILNPENTWADKAFYKQEALQLANRFIKNFEQYAKAVSPEILGSAPKI